MSPFIRSCTCLRHQLFYCVCTRNTVCHHLTVCSMCVVNGPFNWLFIFVFKFHGMLCGQSSNLPDMITYQLPHLKDHTLLWREIRGKRCCWPTGLFASNFGMVTPILQRETKAIVFVEQTIFSCNQFCQVGEGRAAAVSVLALSWLIWASISTLFSCPVLGVHFSTGPTACTVIAPSFIFNCVAIDGNLMYLETFCYSFSLWEMQLTFLCWDCLFNLS